MTARSPSAFLLSFALHAFVVGIALLVGYATRQSTKDIPKIFELVAGAGDNYLAREAPALGTEGGVKVNLPNTSPKAQPQPVKAEAPPVIPTPAPKQAPKVVPAPKTEPKTADISKKLKQDIQRADRKAKNEVKKEREAEAKRLAEEQKRMTKEEFDRANKTKATAPPTKSGPPRVARIDAEGIAKGVVGGSTKNKTGGAGGKALTADTATALEAYYSLFRQKIWTNFEKPSNASDSLEATVSVRIDANGVLSNPRVIKSSGLREFDQAVIDAVRQIRMPERPDKTSGVVEFTFAMREQDRG